MSGFNEASLETIGDGQAIQKFNHELQRAIENCLDINTELNFTREVILKIKIKPSEDRQTAAIHFQASSKIAPDAPGQDQMYFGKNNQAFINSAKQITFEDYTQSVSEIEQENQKKLGVE
jgi:hypothetical protein